ILNFVTPFLYTLKYNRKGLEGVAFSLEYYALPFLVLFILGESYGAVKYLDVLFALCFAVLVYEIGYIHNNVVAIKFEKNPTIMHSERDLHFAESKFSVVIAVRVILSFLVVSYYIFHGQVLNSIVSVVLGALTVTVFVLYNRVRTGSANRFLFFVLR